MAPLNPAHSIRTPWESTSASQLPYRAADDQLTPITVPDHTLVRPIGRGAYGEVWLAKNVLGQFRAVKVLRRAAFDHERPFEREFAGIQRFEPVSRSHESQLNILHVGRTPDAIYYVMELADDMGHGAAIDESSYSPRTLKSELMLHGRIPVEECIRLGLALTTALGHLHRHGLVHRDIKPGNIIFVNGIPKLADLGLVAQAERTMSFVGTEGYLPPEGPGTVQADLFSLGKVLYEISTGNDRQQFPDLPTGVEDLPERVALAEFNEVLIRACAPDPKKRYQTAAEMHADLALLQSGKSVARMRGAERRLRMLVRGGGVIALIALLAAGAFGYQRIQTREARELAAQNRKLVEEGRAQLARLSIANGNRLLDQDDPAGALLWFTRALPLLTNNPSQEGINRTRIQQALDNTPRLLRVFPHDSGILCSAFSHDGRFIATGSGRTLRLWNADNGELIWKSTDYRSVEFVRFSNDGRTLFASSSREHIASDGGTSRLNFAVALDRESGKELWSALASLGIPATNLTASAFSADDRWVAWLSRIIQYGLSRRRIGKW